MNTKILIPAGLLFLSILNFAGYAQPRDEKQMNEILKLWESPISLNWRGNANTSVSPASTYVQKPTDRQNYANRNIVFRHLILGHFSCNLLNSKSEQRAGG